MERGKSGTGRGSKNKIAPHPSDFIALGSKSSRGDVPDTKRPGVGLTKPGSSSTSTSKLNCFLYSSDFKSLAIYIIVFIVQMMVF